MLSFRNHKNLVAVCGDDRVRIVDWDLSHGFDVCILWEWRIDEVYAQLPDKYRQYLYALDECKFVDNNEKLLITASSGAVILLDIISRECLFYAYAPMAHSAELLPDGRLVVTLSTHPDGNCIQLYDMKYPEKLLYKDRLYFGHGAVWSQKRKRLYAVGYSKLREYRLKKWNTSSPELERLNTWTLPINAGHDLCMVHDDLLLIPGREGVTSFLIDEKVFLPFTPLAHMGAIKSLNYNPITQSAIFTKGEVKWWTYHVYQNNPDKFIQMDDFRIYKARTANEVQ